MPLLILIFPFAEFYVFYRFIDAYSFLDALLLVVLSSLAGVLIMKSQGKAALALFQQNLAQGKLPATKILHRSVIVVGGLLLFIPGIISDVLGILCILPGSRHLIVFYLKLMFAKGLLKGQVFVSGFASRAGGFDQSSKTREERDVQVVDIEPIEISHTRKD
jgi:UPF0716 family protein affecting phage T7 exclusion